MQVLAVERPQPRVLDLAAQNSADRGPPAPLSVRMICRVRTISSLTRALALDAAGTVLAAAGDARVVQLWSLLRAHGTHGRTPAEVEFRCATQVRPDHRWSPLIAAGSLIASARL